MGNLSAHFDLSEFKCPCCGKANPSKLLIERLEKVYTMMNAKSIIITSGYRCPSYSKKVGGFANDAHTCNIAADIIVNKKSGGTYSAEDIAEAAERVGFGGIGLMNGACHVDNRDCETYVNNHWFGDERDGRNYIKTFQRGTKFEGETPAATDSGVTISLTINGESYTGTVKKVK